jgi:hypothetical protein
VNIFETKLKKHPETPAKPKALLIMSASYWGIFPRGRRPERVFSAKRCILRQIVCPHTAGLDDF